MKNSLVIGTRGSKLALFQANLVLDKLSLLFPDLSITLKIIKTKGDKLLDKSLSTLLDKGFFTTEIQLALESEEIDIAVHSLKDLPTELPSKSMLGAILKRHDHRDVFISNNKKPLKDFSPKDIIGTSSLRRKSQLLAFNSKLTVREIRGNVDTRIQKMLDGHYDGLVTAAAGVIRLGLEKYITQFLDTDFMLTAPGQAAIAIEIRQGDTSCLDIVTKINDRNTQICVTTERDFLHALSGGCHVPFAAHATLEDNTICLEALVGSEDGSEIVKESLKQKYEANKQLGSEIADKILAKGGREIIKNLSQNLN